MIRGSIPAYAGEPSGGSSLRSPVGVDPRLRGGAAIAPSHLVKRMGRSPLTRGSPPGCAENCYILGSIPAYAGEPDRRWRRAGRCWVDPRLRGGAGSQSRRRKARSGRSPQVRGSLGAALGDLELSGSIPAYAGEPKSASASDCAWRVDPRVSGRAVLPPASTNDAWGRSPLTRGSPGQGPAAGARAGSIPAYVGEPRRPCRPAARGEVDPRLRGGASDWSTVNARVMGRSPLTRGSLSHLLHRCCVVGSIPAYAGEPQQIQIFVFIETVDPRLRGGAVLPSATLAGGLGRSPLTRGSHLHSLH